MYHSYGELDSKKITKIKKNYYSKLTYKFLSWDHLFKEIK